MITSQGAVYNSANGGLNWKAQVKETIDDTLNRVSSSGTSGASFFTGKITNQVFKYFKIIFKCYEINLTSNSINKFKNPIKLLVNNNFKKKSIILKSIVKLYVSIFEL